MASYLPPTENLAIFDPSVFKSAGTEALTYDEAVKYFLKYPNAQGTENLQTINVNGTATFNTGVVMNDGASMITNVANPLFIVDDTDPTKKSSIYQDLGVLRISNTENGGTLIFSTNNSSGVSQNIISGSSTAINLTTAGQIVLSGSTSTIVNGTDFTIQTTNPPTCSATQPASTDSSTKIPTTAWVQSAISGSVSQTNSAEHYSTALNNAYPFGTNLATIPLINFADVNTYASTYGMNYWDAVVFDFVFNLTISGSNTGTTDAGGVIIANNQCSGQMYIYPTAFTTTVAPYFYLNGGIGSTSSGSSTYYACPITTYTPNGRPFWVNNLLNQANVAVCMPIQTINTGTTAQLIFQFAPISWNTTTQCNWNLSLTLRNSGKIPASKITTLNFNINNI